MNAITAATIEENSASLLDAQGLDALEDELLPSSKADKHGRGTLYLVDLQRRLTEEVNEIIGQLPYVPDEPVRAHLRRTVESLEPLITETRRMIRRRMQVTRARLPHYAMYPADFDIDENVRGMTDDEVGFYVRCLNHTCLNGGLPVDPEEVERVIPGRRDHAAFVQIWKRVSPCFQTVHTQEGPRLVNPRRD